MARRVEAVSSAPRRGRHSAPPQSRRERRRTARAAASGPAVEASSSGVAEGAPVGATGVRPPTASPAPGRRRRRPRRRRRTGERVLRVAIVFVAVTLVGASSVYGYLRFRLSQITAIKCHTCAAVADGTPYNVLIVGSDSRAGNSGAAARAFGSASLVGGQRSDTIKILHVDPAAGTARLLSIPRDTYVALSDMPASSGLSVDNKINAGFNYGPDALIQTIQNTFGITISHFVIIDFTGVINLVDSVNGINMNFPYPVRDDDNGNNNSGLYIPHAGCQTLNGNTALALARSRFFQYEVRPGYWRSDPSGDLGRIQRQNAIIEATIDKARSSYNPLTINAFLGSVVHDVTVDQNLSGSDLLSLAQKYHAFSGSSLETVTLPTVGTYSPVGGDVQVVQQPQAEQVIAQFLGTQPSETVTPPIDAYGAPVTVPPTTTAPATTPGTSGTSSSPPTTAVPGTGPFNPTPC